MVFTGSRLRDRHGHGGFDNAGSPIITITEKPKKKYKKKKKNKKSRVYLDCVEITENRRVARTAPHRPRVMDGGRNGPTLPTRPRRPVLSEIFRQTVPRPAHNRIITPSSLSNPFRPHLRRYRLSLSLSLLLLYEVWRVIDATPGQRCADTRGRGAHGLGSTYESDYRQFRFHPPPRSRFIVIFRTRNKGRDAPGSQFVERPD